MCLCFFCVHSFICAVPRFPRNEHETFLLAEPMLDPEVTFPSGPSGRIVVSMSTEHLLLNAWRAKFHGMPLQVLVDCTYKMTHEKYTTMLIGVFAMDQVFHVVSYAIVNHEDDEGHRLAMAATKAAVEATVQKYQGGLV